MIITQTPFRMSFFGGGTDLPAFFNEHGGAVLSTSFDKYCYVNVRHLPRFFDYTSEISYSRLERVTDVNDIRHPAVREAMKQRGSGYILIYALKGKYADKKKLADDAIYLERVLCNEAGGLQDQIAASFGGFNRINFHADGYTVNPVILSPQRKKELNSRLMLFFTGFSRFSSDIQTATTSAVKDKTAQLREMLSLVDEAEKVLTSGRHDENLDEFGRLLDHTWRLKRGITSRISTDSIDGLYEKAMAAGALGGKLLGAGGGGFLLFYVEPERRESVMKALEQLLYVPFEFENAGTRVIFYDPESYELPEKS